MTPFNICAGCHLESRRGRAEGSSFKQYFNLDALIFATTQLDPAIRDIPHAVEAMKEILALEWEGLGSRLALRTFVGNWGVAGLVASDDGEDTSISHASALAAFRGLMQETLDRLQVHAVGGNEELASGIAGAGAGADAGADAGAGADSASTTALFTSLESSTSNVSSSQAPQWFPQSQSVEQWLIQLRVPAVQAAKYSRALSEEGFDAVDHLTELVSTERLSRFLLLLLFFLGVRTNRLVL